MPIRIQRKRHRGWKKPKNAIYVGRWSKWANPFILDTKQNFIYIKRLYPKGSKISAITALFCHGNKASMLKFYESLVLGKKLQSTHNIYNYWYNHFLELNTSELKGKDLMCWCNLDEKCHADILLRLANNKELQ